MTGTIRGQRHWTQHLRTFVMHFAWCSTWTIW